MIKVNDNTLINSRHISAIETKMVNKKQIYVAIVGGKTYEIKIPIEQFLASIDKAPDMGTQHHFAG
jgi:hypothetical protein